MYSYWGFGLNIASEIEFPEMYPAEFDLADVTISLDKISILLTNTNDHYIHRINDKELLFEVKGIATYYVANGKSIFINIDERNAELRNVRLFTLATAMAAILFQRNLIPFHSSAIIKDNHLSLITGDSGAGKSTSVAGLIKKGYPIFSDDIVVLHKNVTEKILAYASYPMIKLWDDTVVSLEHEMFNDRSFAVKPGIDKYGIFFHDKFDKSSYYVENIIILKKGVNAKIIVKELHGGEAFAEVAKQVYRPGLLKGASVKKMRFDILTGLLKTSHIFEITRPEDGSIEKMLLQIEELL